jgi:hypothetical protein
MFGDFQLNTRIANPGCAAAASVLGCSAAPRLETQKAFSLIYYFIALFRKPALPKAQFSRRSGDSGHRLSLGTLKSPGIPIRADVAQDWGKDAVAGSRIENAQTP